VGRGGVLPLSRMLTFMKTKKRQILGKVGGFRHSVGIVGIVNSC